jgi:hypothetical protein
LFIAAIGDYFAETVFSVDLYILDVAVFLWGMLRINEVGVTHISQIVLGPINPIRSARRSLLLLMVNYAELILLFSTCYAVLSNAGLIKVEGPCALSLLRESMGLMLANSSGSMKLEADSLPWALVTLQSAVGLYMTTLVAARLISLLPAAQTLDKEEI